MDEDLPVPEQAVLAVLYAPGQRPSLGAVRAAGEASGAFAVSHDPGDEQGGSGGDAGWAELLITGLTFDITGLAPGKGEAVPSIVHRFGFAPDEAAGDGLEAVFLRPGAHLAGAAAMLPVVRGCVALGSALATGTGAAAIVWIPARAAMTTDYFTDVAADWLGGGAFPALGLTALVPGGSGMVSDGLAFFTGQELEVCGPDMSRAVRIAVRMIHALVCQAPVVVPVELVGPDGELLLAEPIDKGTRVRVGPRR